MTDEARERVKRFIDDALANPNRDEAYATVRARWEEVVHQLEHPPDDETAEADLSYEALMLRTAMANYELRALLESEAKLRSAPNN